VITALFCADGKTLASYAFNNTIKLWDAPTGKERATLQGHTQLLSAVAFSLGHSWGRDRTIIKLWDVPTRK
jgi:WD40 repeat protein